MARYSVFDWQKLARVSAHYFMRTRYSLEVLHFPKDLLKQAGLRFQRAAIFEPRKGLGPEEGTQADMRESG